MAEPYDTSPPDESSDGSSPPSPASSAPPPAVRGAVGATHVVCATCGYNLTGVAIGGACPECGSLVNPSYHSVIKPTSGYAIASLVLGISSIVTCMCYAVPGIICGVLALIFWHLAKPDIRSGRVSSGSSGLATAGAITGGIGIGLSVLTIAFFVFVIIMDSI